MSVVRTALYNASGRCKRRWGLTRWGRTIRRMVSYKLSYRVVRCRTVLSYSWGGGSAIYRIFTAILPQFFSDASIQKFHFPPEEKYTSPSHTVRVCALICPACHLCGRTLFSFCVPKMSSTPGDSDLGNGKRPVKPGKGQSGQKARYATQIPRLHGVGTGSVGRFFSFCKYTDTDQRYSMSDNACRVAFMAHYNGGVEGWLD